MYGVYNTLHSRQSMCKKLFAGQIIKAYRYHSQMHGDHGIQHYAINSMPCLRTIRDKYIKLCNEFISQLHNYAKAFRILAKGHLPISPVTLLKLHEILAPEKETHPANIS